MSNDPKAGFRTVEAHVRFVRGFFGIGFGGEIVRLCDEAENVWWGLNWKLFLGQVIIYGVVNFRKANTERHAPSGAR
jgi:hypothetical protein